jgi:hypothetical protein
MILKFKTFINESKIINESLSKTEYQILHLNREERMDYFEERLYYFERSDFDDLNIQFGNNENGYKTEYFPFLDYELSLCPPKIKNKYIQICIDKGLGIPLNEIDSLTPNQRSLFLDSCAKNARSSYVRLNILKLFSDKQMYVYLVNSIKKKKHLSDKAFIFLSDKFKKFYMDKCIQYKSPISSQELFWIKPDEDRIYYTNYYINTCIEKGGELKHDQIDTLTDEQKLVYYTNQVEKGNVSIAYRSKEGSDESIEFDLNQYELDRLKKKLNK